MLPKLLIVAHDAGGADILASWLHANGQHADLNFCLEGPARDVFRRYFPTCRLITEADALCAGADWGAVYTGTSVCSDIELRAIKHARTCGIPSVCYLDHWVNFRIRFQRDEVHWQDALPDEVWCGDSQCLENCLLEGFPPEILKLVPNIIFENLQRRATFDGGYYLYLCEPLTPADRIKFGYDEFDALELFFTYLLNNRDSQKPILIRTHPSEMRNKYASILERRSWEFDVRQSNRSDYVEDCAGASAVYGRESMALAHCLFLGKKVVSIIPGHSAFGCVLPFLQIDRVRM